jgi:hypothetical protein
MPSILPSSGLPRFIVRACFASPSPDPSASVVSTVCFLGWPQTEDVSSFWGNKCRGLRLKGFNLCGRAISVVARHLEESDLARAERTAMLSGTPFVDLISLQQRRQNTLYTRKARKDLSL